MANKEVIIFGAGLTGEKFICKNYENLKISCFWDNTKSGEFLGYPVKKPNSGLNCFIIVTSLYYFNIRQQLQNLGYREFEDFIPYQIFRKKIAVAYGNCHMDAIKSYMECHREFSAEYGFYPFPSIQNLKDFKCDYADILTHCDLLLHQSVRKDNVFGEKYSSKAILRNVKKGCVVIACPNLYGMPKYLFPQLDKKYDWKIGTEALFFIDSNIVSWIGKGKNLSEIKTYMNKGGVYSKRDIIDMWDHFLLKMEEREKEWNVKIADYIIENQKTRKIFCDINHITSETAHIIADRTLLYMGYKEQYICELPILDDLETFIYEDVREAMDIKFEEQFIRKYKKQYKLDTCEMDFDVYSNQIYHYTLFYMNHVM